MKEKRNNKSKVDSRISESKNVTKKKSEKMDNKKVILTAKDLTKTFSNESESFYI